MIYNKNQIFMFLAVTILAVISIFILLYRNVYII